jgi:ABC-type transport system involved in cytochrome c biogenesis permease subunit
MKNKLHYLPWLVALLAAGYLLSKARPQHADHPANVDLLASTFVSYEGRVQPLDSVARNSLLLMSAKTTWHSDFLTVDQIKDWQGLAKALVEAGKSESASAGKHIWSLLTESQRDAVKQMADAQTGTDAITPAKFGSLQLKMLDALNAAIDDVARAVDADSALHAAGGSHGDSDFKPFFDSKVFADIQLDPLEKMQQEKIEKWVQAGAPVHGGQMKIPSRPLTLELNRAVLSRSLPQFFAAERAKKQPAILWLADVMCDPQKAAAHRVFRIVHPRLIQMLGLEERPGFRYSLDEFVEIDKLPTLLQNPLYDDELHQGNLGKLQYEVRIAGQDEKDDPFVKQANELLKHISVYTSMARKTQPYFVPPQAGAGEGEWRRLWDFNPRRTDAGGVSFGNDRADAVWATLVAFAQHDVEAFDAKLAAHRAAVAEQLPSDARRTRYEVFFNQFDVFYYCTVLYVGAFLLVMFSFLFAGSPGVAAALRHSALAVLIVAGVAHGFGLLSRMYLMERPFVFVTNLYSTAIFIGWVALASAILIELVTRLGIGSLAAAMIGVITGILAVNLRIDHGDTLGMMQAVLDTNFWLATHVTTINIGYAATYLAGAIAIAYIFGGVLTRGLTPQVRKTLTQMMYGTICFALLFSFVGTVLGGIWADQSWGRFWGWDPKENGALMIVLWNALILHARWGGMVQARGIANLAVFGNIVTTWSYFGTNQLGVGLHSYGFTESATFYILVFVGTQLAIMAVGLIPLRFWRSFSEPKDAQPQGKPALA